MDMFDTPSELGVASQVNVKSLRAASPSLIQVPAQSISIQALLSNDKSQYKSTRNFSRKLYSTPEIPPRSPLRCPSKKVVNLTSGLTFIDFAATQPLHLEPEISSSQEPELQISAELHGSAPVPCGSSTEPSRPVTPPTVSSVPSTPVVSKPVRPSFGRSVSLFDSVKSTNAALQAKRIAPTSAPMDQPRKPALTRSPATIGSPQLQQNPSNKFTSVVGEKIGWLRSRAFSNVSATSTSSAPASPAAVQQVREDADLLAADPLINLDISAALFPTGIVDFTDASSFNGLLANATALIETLQTAYKQRTLEINKLRAEQASQAEDLDETETRCRHLRLQLSTMSSRMTETEMSLRSQLAEECQQRKALEIKEKERTARRRTNPYRPNSSNNNNNNNTDAIATSPTTSTASEEADSGFESDGESHYSTTPSSVSSTAGASSFTSKHDRATPDLISSCTSPAPSDALWERTGAAAAAAAGNFDPLAENFALRHRVAELEGAVEACLRLI